MIKLEHSAVKIHLITVLFKFLGFSISNQQVDITLVLFFLYIKIEFSVYAYHRHYCHSYHLKHCSKSTDNVHFMFAKIELFCSPT